MCHLHIVCSASVFCVSDVSLAYCVFRICVRGGEGRRGAGRGEEGREFLRVPRAPCPCSQLPSVPPPLARALWGCVRGAMVWWWGVVQEDPKENDQILLARTYLKLGEWQETAESPRGAEGNLTGEVIQASLQSYHYACLLDRSWYVITTARHPSPVTRRPPHGLAVTRIGCHAAQLSRHRPSCTSKRLPRLGCHAHLGSRPVARSLGMLARGRC
jgi:hypothetical protein